MWSEANVGKFRGKGKTLPQIIAIDPDWFFWAFENQIVGRHLKSEAEKLARRTKSILLPVGLAGTHCVAYLTAPSGRFGGANVVPWDRPLLDGPHSERREGTLDLSASRRWKDYDKLGGKWLIRTLRHHWFSDAALTKKRIEEFADQPSNFEFPWDSCDPELIKAEYRNVVETCRLCIRSTGRTRSSRSTDSKRHGSLSKCRPISAAAPLTLQVNTRRCSPKIEGYLGLLIGALEIRYADL